MQALSGINWKWDIKLVIQAFKIDVANILVSTIDTERPSTYRETILRLSKLGIIPDKFAKDLSKMIGFRNILVHDYIKIDEDIILEILNKKLDDFIKYLNFINKWLEENY